MFLFLLCLFSGFVFAEIPTLEVIGKRYNEIYIDDAIVKQDGITISKYDYTPIILSYMALHHSTFYKNGEIGGIYDKDSIDIAEIDCDFKKDSLKCGSENEIWVLKSVIAITRKQAYVTLILHDETGNIISSATISKRLRRKIIPRKKRTVNSVPAGIGMSGRTKTSCRSKEDCTQQTSGVIAGRSATSVQTEDLPPTIINFPAIIRNEDIRQAAILLYTSIR